MRAVEVFLVQAGGVNVPGRSKRDEDAIAARWAGAVAKR